MKKLLVIWIIIMKSNCILSQVNLVPNPSFEIHDSCPNSFNSMSFATGWSGYFGTPDYFNICSPSINFCIPKNIAGFQIPNDLGDSAYAGFGTNIQSNHQHEVLGCRLQSPLVYGQKYYISFLYSAAFNDMNSTNDNMVCFCSNIGVKFTTNYLDSFSPFNYLLIDNYATLYDHSIFNDTSEWKLFSGSFVADSVYTQLLIGNFYQIDYFSHYCSNVLGFKAYVYIDNVCLSSYSNYCYSDTVNKNANNINVANNITQNELVVSYPGMNYIEIYDMLGKVLLSDSFNGSIAINYFNWSQGIYILKVDNQSYKFHVLK